MKTKVIFQKFEKINNVFKEELSFETNGILQNNILSFIDNEKIINVVTLDLPSVKVERKGEIVTILTFEQKKKTTLLIKTNFGNLNIDIYTQTLKYENNQLDIIYDVFETDTEFKTYKLKISLIHIK